MNYATRLLSCFVLLTTLNGCGNYYYSTTELNLAHVSEPGDFKIAASRGAQSNIWSKEGIGQRYFSAAVSPFRHFALTGNYTRVSGGIRATPNQPPYGGGNLMELAAGTYYKVLETEEGVNLLADLYAGYGQGDFELFYESGTSSTGRFRRSSLQLGLHLSYQKWMSMDVGWRASVLNYRDLIFRNVVADEDAPVGFAYIADNNPFRLNAFGIRMQVGFPSAKTYLSYTFADAPQTPYFRFLNQTFNLGVMVEIDEFFRKRK